MTTLPRVFIASIGAALLTACATIPPAEPGAAAPASTPPAAAATPAAPSAPPAAVVTAPSAQAIANAQRLAGAPGSATPTPPAPPPAPGALRSFADVAKDYKELPGMLPLWQKDDKVFIELAPDQFDRLYFLSTNLDHGLGEGGLLAGSMGARGRFASPSIVIFRKVGGSVQLISRNVKYMAKAGTPEARAVAESFSDSLLASAAILSAPHPERKSVLIEANAIFFSDLTATAPQLERAYRQPYGFDARNTSFKEVRSTKDFVSFNVLAHYALARISLPAAGAPVTPPPATIPDIRSLFLGFHYSIARLPDTPMRPRTADTRVGYFTTERWDFTTDDRRIPIVRYANRWRLEKKDPTAEMSEPVQPIVYWIDRTVPDRYRATIRDGVLEWNKAFARIGYKDAIRVEVQPENADFNTSDIRHASIRWITAARSSYLAIGPSLVDPRTGEILDADIGIDAMSLRSIKTYGAETVPLRPSLEFRNDAPYCTYAAEAAEHEGFAMSLLEARGSMMLDSVQAEEFLLSRLKSTTMHEVGHTLGLTHNFRASTVYTAAQLSDPEFTRQNGIAGSVMEYNAVNLAVPGEKQGEFHMSTLGPYDYWAIEYGYREFKPEEEAAALLRVGSRSSEPLLAFTPDSFVYYSGLDPVANTFDLGNDPLAYAERQLKLARELWQLSERRKLEPDESYAVLRRNFSRGLFEVQQSALHTAKYIGGLTVVQDSAGSGRTPLEPVPAAKQRAALQLLADNVFAADSFRFPPAYMRKLSLTDFDIYDATEVVRSTPAVDIAVDQIVLNLHRAVLGPLLGPEIAQRLLNNELKVAGRGEALRLVDLYGTLHRAIFSELTTGQDIPLIRRNLQREYVSRITNVILRPANTMPADARALLRADARRLRDEIANRKRADKGSPEARAHLAETLATLDDALRAPLIRLGV
ncbi:MAG: zinc-dependent metalloprotease [Casimicrobiaceae bacterium]